jgi:tetratricopeptide (TPR) repeat protein
MDMAAQQDLDVKPFVSSASDQWNQRDGRTGETLIVNTDHRMKQTVSALFFFLVVLLIVYAPSFSGAWVYDDDTNILNNDNIHLERINFTSLKKTFFLKAQVPNGGERVARPLAYLSFALNWYVGKDHVFGYHVVNFIIHLTATVFLYLFIKDSLVLPRFNNRYRSLAHPVAFLSAMIWAIHPIQVTAVTYIVQRMASMAGMFTIVSLYAYLKARTSSTRGRRIACLSACVLFALCAFATKENSAMLPVSLLFYEILMIRGVAHTDLKKWLRWGLPALTTVLLLGPLYANPTHLLDGYGNRPYTAVERVMTESRVILYYLCLLFYPLLSEFTLIHDVAVSTSLWSPWTTLASVITIAGLMLSSILWLSRRHPILVFSVWFFFINHFIEGSFIALELIYEHRNYIPSMFLFVLPSMLLIHTLTHFSYHKKLQIFFIICCAIILSSIGHTTHAFNHLFRHNLILWKDNAQKSPGLSVVHNNYGTQLMGHGFYDDAFRSFQNAIIIDRYFNLSQKGISYYNMGVYFETVVDDQAAALRYYRKAVDISFSSKVMWHSLSMSLLLNGEFEHAENQLKKGLEKWPDDPDFTIALGKVYYKKGNLEAALFQAIKAWGISKTTAAPLALLGGIYRQKGETQRAIMFWKHYLQKKPQSLVAVLCLTELYYQIGKWNKLNTMVAKLQSAKGCRTWNEWLQENLNVKEGVESVMFAPAPKKILSIISTVLKRQVEDIDAITNDPNCESPCN